RSNRSRGAPAPGCLEIRRPLPHRCRRQFRLRRPPAGALRGAGELHRSVPGAPGVPHRRVPVAVHRGAGHGSLHHQARDPGGPLRHVHRRAHRRSGRDPRGRSHHVLAAIPGAVLRWRIHGQEKGTCSLESNGNGGWPDWRPDCWRRQASRRRSRPAARTMSAAGIWWEAPAIRRPGSCGWRAVSTWPLWRIRARSSWCRCRSRRVRRNPTPSAACRGTAPRRRSGRRTPGSLRAMACSCGSRHPATGFRPPAPGTANRPRCRSPALPMWRLAAAASTRPCSSAMPGARRTRSGSSAWPSGSRTPGRHSRRRHQDPPCRLTLATVINNLRPSFRLILIGTHGDLLLKTLACRLVLLLALLLHVPAALALGLGQIEVKSRAGEPLLAEIPIISTDPSELENLQARLASPETFRRIGLEPPAGLVSDLRFSIALDPRGRPVIRITSDVPVQQPLLTFLVEVDWGQGRLVREYSALVDTPQTVAAPAQPPIQAPEAAPSNLIARTPPPEAAQDAAPEASPAEAAEDAEEAPPTAEADVPAPAPAPTPSAPAAAGTPGEYGPV